MKNRLLLIFLLALFSGFGAGAADYSIPFSDGTLKLTPLSDNAVRVRFSKTAFHSLPELVYTSGSPAVRSSSKVSGRMLTVKMKGMTVKADAGHQTVSVFDRNGRLIFFSDSLSLVSHSLGDDRTYTARMSVKSGRDEFIFGLGQFQDGQLNVNGLSRRLTQVNTQISFPMIISDTGYGLLWNNYGMTEFNPSRYKAELSRQAGAQGTEAVNVTSTEGNRREIRQQGGFNGTIEVNEDGNYAFLLDVGQKMARRKVVAVDGRTCVDEKNTWLPPTSSFNIFLKAGKHEISASLEANDSPVLYYSPVTDHNVFSSPVADAVDYTVFAGGADEVVSSYRKLTGGTPMMPQWALGYIHCRERYDTQEELLSNAERFRKDNIPLDVIVQDWQYWGKYGWNAMRFDENKYPDPTAMMDSLHHMNIHFMISVWAKIAPESEVGKIMQAHNYYIPGTQWIDFFNPDAASTYWNEYSARMLKPYHIDAWWQDATEPENDDISGRMVNNGTQQGDLYRNVYPLMVNKTVYEGLRRDDPARRTMILTRCGFPGLQRYGAAVWSGDVGNDWQSFRYQITAGLGLMASGMPWWTYDAGGFFRPGDQYTDAAYTERMLRWIETAVYLPLMRVHGYRSNTEPWNYSAGVEEIYTNCIRERYRLLPYIYSNAAMVSFDGGTLMRPFIFDFPEDKEALRQKTEYMFGRSLLVSPVTEASVTSWKTYLPDNGNLWYEIRTGEKFTGGRYVTTAVTPDRIPVFAKAGSIIPFGPDLQYASEKTGKDLAIRVFEGADADFTLYEDAGDNYNYEKGEFSRIAMHWNNGARTLTISSRQGGFNGMMDERHWAISLQDGSTKEIVYAGKKTVVKF